MTVEIHGFTGCPFSWRARLAAAFKGVSIDWLPCDIENPDERCGTHNPEKRSPLLYDDGFILTDAMVIASYLDEANAGPPMQPVDPKARATARLALIELARLQVPGHIDVPPPVRKQAEATLVVLERHLADGRAFVDGAIPGLLDVQVIPALAMLAWKEIPIPVSFAASQSYWQRSLAHPAYLATKPPWAPTS